MRLPPPATTGRDECPRGRRAQSSRWCVPLRAVAPSSLRSRRGLVVRAAVVVRVVVVTAGVVSVCVTGAVVTGGGAAVGEVAVVVVTGGGVMWACFVRVTVVVVVTVEVTVVVCECTDFAVTDGASPPTEGEDARPIRWLVRRLVAQVMAAARASPAIAAIDHRMMRRGTGVTLERRWLRAGKAASSRCRLQP